jgi:hypothetical protein
MTDTPKKQEDPVLDGEILARDPSSGSMMGIGTGNALTQDEYAAKEAFFAASSTDRTAQAKKPDVGPILYSAFQKDIHNAKRSFLEMGLALNFINDTKLYQHDSDQESLEGNNPFNKFLDNIVKIPRSTAYSYMQVARIGINFKEAYSKHDNDDEYLIYPAKESHFKALKGIDEGEIVVVWEKAIKLVQSRKFHQGESVADVRKLTRDEAAKEIRVADIKAAIEKRIDKTVYKEKMKGLVDEIRDNKKPIDPTKVTTKKTITKLQKEAISAVSKALLTTIEESRKISAVKAGERIERSLKVICKTLGNDDLFMEPAVAAAISTISASIVKSGMENAKKNQEQEDAELAAKAKGEIS